MEKKALLKLGYSCNNNCLICHSIEKKEYLPLNIQKVIEKIKLCKSKGIKFILFSGGEPTIRKDLITLARFIKESDMLFGLITNARVLSYREYLDKLEDFNLKYAYVSFYSANEKIHNRLTGDDSFNQTIKGIKNIAKKTGIKLIVNIPVTKININTLNATIDMLNKLKVRNIKFSFLELKGNALENLKKVIVPAKVAADKVQEAMIYAEKKGLNVMVGGFPSCIIKGFGNNIDDFKSQEIEYISEAFESELFEADNEDKIKTEKCKDCEVYCNCVGLDKNYINLFGDKELSPIKKISNSAFFAISKKIKKEELKKIKPGYNEILLEMKQGIHLFSYNSNDFSKSDLERIKQKGQIYTEEGKKCIKSNQKNNFYVISSKEGMSFNENIKSELHNLNGNVLDIGCGQLYFCQPLKTMAEINKIRYVGVDPIKVYIKNKNMEFIQKKFEETEFSPNSFDYILMLGSYNHMQDITLVLRQVYCILKDGGKLIVSDDEPLIILGKGDKSKHRNFEDYRNDSVSEAKKNLVKLGLKMGVIDQRGFEHYRNDSVSEAKKNLVKSGFKIKRKLPVSNRTGNKWIITCIKPSIKP